MSCWLRRESGAQHPGSSGRFECGAHGAVTLDQVRIPGKLGRPRKRSRWLLYDAEHLRHYCDSYRM